MFDVIRSLVLPAADIARLLTLYVDLLGFVPAGQADPHPAWQQLWDLPVCPTRTVHSPKGAVAAHPVRDAGRKQSTWNGSRRQPPAARWRPTGRDSPDRTAFLRPRRSGRPS